MRTHFARLLISHALLVAIALAAPSACAADATGLAAIRVPEGYTVEVAAAAPLVERPMLACFDDQGRLYVCDSSGVNLRGPQLSKDPPHSIRMLTDTDGDGRFDKSVIYADKMVFPQGIVWHEGAIYCSSPPSFWKLQDTDGDGVADQREELVTGFANTGVADDMHGGSLGPDGWLYWCAGRFPHNIRRPGGPTVHQGTAPLIVRCRPDGSQLEIVCGSQGNAVGVVWNDAGDMFSSGTYLAPNSMGAGLRDALVHCIDGAEYPVRDRVLNEHKRTGDLLPPLTHLGVAAASDLMIARSSGWDDAHRGNLFSALFNMHKIMRHTLEPAGATFHCRNEDFLVSSDTDFHPTDVFEDADGSMLVVDTGGWFRIGCPTSQIAKPEVLGAIYRVRRTGAKPIDDPRGLKLGWKTMPPAKLAPLLADDRFAVRDRAASEISKQGAASVAPLIAVLSSDATIRTKCAAGWALSRVDHDDARAALRKTLQHSEPGVRQVAARALGLYRDADSTSSLMKLTTDQQPAVRREAATALGRIKDKQAVPALVEALSAGGDRFLEHAVIFALIQIGDRDALARAQAAPPTVQRGLMIATDQMSGGGLDPEQVSQQLTSSEPLVAQTALWIVGHHPEWGAQMAEFFGDWLKRGETDPAKRDELRKQLLVFAKNDKVQTLIAERAADLQTAEDTRLLLLEVMGQAAVAKLPDAWVAPLSLALADTSPRIVRQSVATLRALPLEKRPLVTRVDAQIDFPETTKKFGGTALSENFCVRWTGLVRCPKNTTYTFFTSSDDGSQLFIDGKRVVDNSGNHSLRERQGRVKLTAGDHELRLEFIQGEGEAACQLSWEFDGTAKQIVPAAALFHRARGAEQPQPGLTANYFELGGRVETFADPAASSFDAPLTKLALDTGLPEDLRVQAAAAVVGRIAAVEPPLFELLRASLAANRPPLVRLDAAEALGKSRLDNAQLLELCRVIDTAGVLEVPRLVRAFDSQDAAVGKALVTALGNSPGLKALNGDALAELVRPYPAEVQSQAQPLIERQSVSKEKQQARMAQLAGVLAGGDIQRGRELFYGNKQAICATCHAAQGQGTALGPDLSKIGAIRNGRDLLEAIVFPSASFARGYEPVTIATLDGQVITGLIARESAEEITIVNTQRIETRVPRANIEALAQSTVSIMPEGMDAQLSRQELADLIAFLQSLR